MSMVVNVHTFERFESVCTATFFESRGFTKDDFAINPTLPDCDPLFYESTGGPGSWQIIECDSVKKEVRLAEQLAEAKQQRIDELLAEFHAATEQTYGINVQIGLVVKFAAAIAQQNTTVLDYLAPLLDWVAEGESRYLAAKNNVLLANSVEEIDATSLQLLEWLSADPAITNEEARGLDYGPN